MTDSELEQLAALYHLGSLSDEEAAELNHRADDPVAAACLRSYSEAAAALVQALPPVAPPAGVKSAILAAIAAQNGGISAIPADAGWAPHAVENVLFKRLSEDERSVTVLYKLGPGAVFPAHEHRGMELCFVVEGEYVTGGRRYRGGDFITAAAGTADDEIRTGQGVTLLVTHAREDFYAA